MGCDGGTIPRRDELVRTKKKPEQVDKNAETVAKWKHCAITQEPLRKPIVSCEQGRLYNKEAVIEHLLNKDATCEKASHLNKLSDVKELNLTEKSGYDDKERQKGDGAYIDYNNSRFICPVTSLDMNGTQRFYFLWGCGCVLSERAIKEVKSETCHKCGKPFTDDDIIIINGSEEEISELKEKMVERRRKAKLLKKKKKSESAVASCNSVKKIKLESVESNSSKSESCEQSFTKLISCEPSSRKLASCEPSSSKSVSCEPSSSKSVSRQPSSSKYDSNGTETIKVIKTEKDSSMKADKSHHTKPKTINLPDKAQRNYSIANDPNASAAFKSLFTTHKTAKNQTKAHWVTHNPLYF